MKKTGFIWFILVIGVLNLILGIASFFAPGVLASAFSSGKEIFNTIISVISIVIWAIYLCKLFTMKGDLIKWTNITFGFDIIAIVLSVFINGGTTIVFYLFSAIIWIVLWVLTYKHLKKISISKPAV